MTIILGIETSCDETGIAIYDNEKGLLGNILYSQVNLHNLYGGVVPELASRDHIKKIIPLIEKCLDKADISLDNIDAISYTAGPGLNGALLVGAGVANGLAFSRNIPVIPIHHLEGHLLSPLLSNNQPTLPFISLLVSGGHSQIIAVKDIGDYTILGESVDDAAGEAFDKTAKMLGLPYPGGKYLAELALLGKEIYELPRPMLKSGDLNMSFAGLKTAVLNMINKFKNDDNFSDDIKANIAKSIEEAITDVLVAKSVQALDMNKINRLVVCGGVSANLTLRNKLNNLDNIQVYYPPIELCTDNGAMIAIAGYYKFNLAKYDYSFSAIPRWSLT